MFLVNSRVSTGRIVRNLLPKVLFTLFVVMPLLVVLSVVFLNKQILRSSSPGFIQLIVKLFYLPDDYYYPLVETELVVSKGKGSNTVLSFANSYNGKYGVEVVFHNFEAELYWNNKRINISGSIECKHDDKLVYSKRITQGSAFLGRFDSGYLVDYYSVPKDIPIDIKLACQFYIEMDERNGPRKLDSAISASSRVFKTLCQPVFTVPYGRLGVPGSESPAVTM